MQCSATNQLPMKLHLHERSKFWKSTNIGLNKYPIRMIPQYSKTIHELGSDSTTTVHSATGVNVTGPVKTECFIVLCSSGEYLGRCCHCWTAFKQEGIFIVGFLLCYTCYEMRPVNMVSSHYQSWTIKPWLLKNHKRWEYVQICSPSPAMVTILHKSKNIERDETWQTNTYRYLERGIQLKLNSYSKPKHSNQHCTKHVRWK